MRSIKISFKSARSTVIEINDNKILIHDIAELDNVNEISNQVLVDKIWNVYQNYKENIIKDYVQLESSDFANELLILDDKTYIFDLNTNSSARNLANEIINCINTNSNDLNSDENQSNVDDELLEFFNSDKYKKQKFDFEWLESDTLRNVTDETLKIVLNLMKKSKYNLSLTDKKLVFNNDIKYLCDRKLTNKDLAGFEDKFVTKNMIPFSVSKDLTVDRICMGCKFQRCPKHLAAYLHFLASTNQLEEKLKDRRENLNKNEMYTFDWTYDEVFKYIPEDLYSFCDELNNKDLIHLSRYFTKQENCMYIKSYYSCSDFKIMELNKEKLETPDIDYNDYKNNLNRKPNRFNLVCKNLTCSLSACIISIAALIQFLKNSGRENEIIEQRKYYHEHQEECDKKFNEMREKQIKELTGDIEESVLRLNKYKDQIENMDVLISTLTNFALKNLFITVEGNDNLEKNDLINDIHKYLYEREKIDNRLITKISLYNLAASNAYPRSIREGKERDLNGVLYNTYEEVKYTLLKPKNLYVIDGLDEFIKDYKEMKDKPYNNGYIALKNKQCRHILDLLSDISANNYIILNTTEEEIEKLFEIEPRLQFIYQNNRYVVPEFSLDDTFDTYVGKLNNELFDKLRQNKETYKKEFLEYVSLNKNFIPFDNRELASYLAMYSNLKGDVIFPQNMYKKETVEEALQNIVGLDTVKQKVKEFEKYMLFKVRAESNNLKLASSNLHMIFTGNPGTGKTTVARIMAKMLYDMGIVKENKLIEVERKDLVASYIGQTATKTSEVIDKAKGGVLFVDEAYTLSSESKNDFGAEAIATLIKAMEDHKDELVVIFAGYKNEMKDFLDINPGISSRIGYTFDFEDYNIEELKQIFYKKIAKMGFSYEEDCDVKLTEVCAYFSKRKSFGNGRFIDKLIQATMLKHATSDTDKLDVLVPSDFPTIKELNNSNENDQTTKELLDNIIGLNDLKEKIKEFEDYVKFVSDARKKNISIPNQNLHMIFTGNPGTGKTTIARIMAKILYNAGIIHENKLVEVEKKDLVGKYTGETAIKTTDIIEKAMGGILFVDEAYALTGSRGSSYGTEAIDTLIKAMEDHKGEFIVIFAGYKKEMAEFMEMNSGIASRIGYTFNFEDYTREELAEILYKKIGNCGFILEESAKENVNVIMNYFARVENIGNGRFADKVFQEILLKHSKNKSDKIEVLTIDDIPTVKEITNSLFNGDNMINPDAITEESLKKTAIHEIGHAFLRYNAYDSPEIIKITINSEGTGALGYVQMKVKEGEYTKTKSKMLKDIMILLGGMASEEVFLGEFANGNSSDLEKATTIAYNMVTKYGMSKLGYGRIFKVDGEMTTIVQNEVNDILKECYEQAIKLINTNKTKMTKVIDYLYEHKEIDEETFIKVFNE